MHWMSCGCEQTVISVLGVCVSVCVCAFAQLCACGKSFWIWFYLKHYLHNLPVNKLQEILKGMCDVFWQMFLIMVLGHYPSVWQKSGLDGVRRFLIGRLDWAAQVTEEVLPQLLSAFTSVREICDLHFVTFLKHFSLYISPEIFLNSFAMVAFEGLLFADFILSIYALCS